MAGFSMNIPLMKPYITDEVKQEVCKVLDSGYLTEGPVTGTFEEAFRSYINCDYALAVCNCTVGLEMALRVLGIGPGDEIIVPDYTYPATASVVNIVGAKIVRVDVDPHFMLIDYTAIENAITSKTKAVMPVSIFGNPLDYDQLLEIKRKYNIYIIEDAACSIGAEFDGIRVGNQADISVFSLHPRKFITTGEGGIITTNNKDWADWMLSYKHFGMGVNNSRLTTSFDRIGTNYKLSNIVSAIGLVQMRHIDTLLAKRISTTARYYALLSEISEIILPSIHLKAKHSYQSCCIFVSHRDRIMAGLKAKGIASQIGTYSLHQHKAFSHNPDCEIRGNMSGSNYAFEHCLTLPMYFEMSNEEQDCVVNELKTLVI
jgi:dTDP-4-amino-4,6-dideoxygalactose transaminase